MIGVSRGSGTMVTAGVCTFVAIAALLTVGGPRPSPVAARKLMFAEMAVTFGDTCYPCKKSYSCDSSFVEGDQCVKCIGSGVRNKCCNMTKDATSTCTYNNQHPCVEHERWRGIPQIPFGTCGSCTSSQFVRDGNCNTLTEAQSTIQCPTPIDCE